ncbi:MAG: hypothetical protein EU547_00560 [Promethearchaeota archaeon]|nr:MAG: hypothetical protein EU547_00560 [Candidatus Lokiarchaeota archaeon]
MLDIPYLIVAFLKIACFASVGLYLLLQWVKLEKKYTSDIPFLMGIALIFFIPGMIIDILYTLEIVGLGLIFNIRYILDMISMILFFGSLLSVWMSSRVKLRYIIITSLTVIFAIIYLLVPAYESLLLLDTVHIFVSLPTILIVIITFLFTYYTKRLTNVHGLLIALAAIVVLVSQIARPVLKGVAVSIIMPSGLAWAANLIAVLGWIILFLGFKLKPAYIENI